MANTVLGTHGSGTHAARPAGNAVPDGSLYSCTTHLLVYVSNYAGNSWSTWANLSGTGMANPMTTTSDIIYSTDNSGTPGRLGIGAAGGALVSLNGALAYNSGTSMPANKATGDRYWRTDLGLEAMWDGTRWVTSTLYRQTFAPTVATSTSNNTLYRVSGPAASGYGWLLVSLEWTTYVITTNNGSNYWSFQFATWDGGTGPTNLGSAFTTAADAADAYVGHNSTTMAGVVASSIELFQIDTTKVSAAGTLIVPNWILNYRLVLT